MKNALLAITIFATAVAFQGGPPGTMRGLMKNINGVNFPTVGSGYSSLIIYEVPGTNRHASFTIYTAERDYDNPGDAAVAHILATVPDAISALAAAGVSAWREPL
ncbi:MAG: hypothetical protein ACYTG6_14425 [Planctomycetota bacterium]|jgi:hypothetical protein